MTHRFPIKEIARQSGLGPATIDRVLNNRPNVSPQTRARVHAAMRELEAQEQQLSARGRRMFVDVVVEAPERFSKQIEQAVHSILPHISTAVFRPRFVMQQVMSDNDIYATLMRIKKRGSHGVLLKARDTPKVRALVDLLEEAGIPVVTLVTDILGSKRTAYVGLDNTQAGKTAAYLLASVVQGDRPTILTSRSQSEFQGESERFNSFKRALLDTLPQCRILEFAGGAGLAGDTMRHLDTQVIGGKPIDAVYSMGGGNRAILGFLGDQRRVPRHYIAHDLDGENLGLLQSGEINFVLHHDLRVDMRHAFDVLSQRHGVIGGAEVPYFSDIQIITPHNLPAMRGEG